MENFNVMSMAWHGKNIFLWAVWPLPQRHLALLERHLATSVQNVPLDPLLPSSGESPRRPEHRRSSRDSPPPLPPPPPPIPSTSCHLHSIPTETAESSMVRQMSHNGADGTSENWRIQIGEFWFLGWWVKNVTPISENSSDWEYLGEVGATPKLLSSDMKTMWKGTSENASLRPPPPPPPPLSTLMIINLYHSNWQKWQCKYTYGTERIISAPQNGGAARRLFLLLDPKNKRGRFCPLPVGTHVRDAYFLVYVLWTLNDAVSDFLVGNLGKRFSQGTRCVGASVHGTENGFASRSQAGSHGGWQWRCAAA